ncbi:DUF2268 domain-containing putative Zn-dependent protease [Bacillus yapensis]|uniref:DUF2268 domain-containing putative Zn-dependent protease n=1 Tax=Bacillus yapensis TaxID=2492960 RepID=UPI001FE932FA|nr:DUF2268 domain-containing putative Zn-dependent protease [Bacillus yapensis]
MEVINLVPKFLDFYRRSNRFEIDHEKRWLLWKEHYNFAAVPPGEDGTVLARRLLDDAWEEYAERLPFLMTWEPKQKKIEYYLSKVKSMLGHDQPIHLVVIYYVGGFENNPFVAPFDAERFALCLPIENGESDIFLSHELTHIVHSHTANLTGEWERTIASTILQEGLAIHVSKFLVLGEPDESYIEHKMGWLKSCKENKAAIIKGILPFLDDSSSETVSMFTFGDGTTDTEREAYFVGWEIVQSLLENGVTFKEIANIKEKDIPNFIREILPLLLDSTSK